MASWYDAQKVAPDQAGTSPVRNRRWNGYAYDPGLFGLSHYDAGRYHYESGYLLRRTSEGRVTGYLPVLGGALAIGNVWPASYESYAVPDYFVDYYDLGPMSSYRYAENVRDHVGGRVTDRRHIRRRAAATGRLRRLQRALFLPRALRRYGGCLVPLFGRACVPDRSPNTAGRGCDRPAGLKVRP